MSITILLEIGFALMGQALDLRGGSPGSLRQAASLLFVEAYFIICLSYDVLSCVEECRPSLQSAYCLSSKGQCRILCISPLCPVTPQHGSIYNTIFAIICQ